MDKQMIEEMAGIQYDFWSAKMKCPFDECPFHLSVKFACNECTKAVLLYNAGYRKIPEGAVVLTREEGQKYLAYKIIEPQIRGCLDRERELEKRLETVRKETAEKFAERAKEEAFTVFMGEPIIRASKIDEIVKELTGEGQ